MNYIIDMELIFLKIKKRSNLFINFIMIFIITSSIKILFCRVILFNIETFFRIFYLKLI